MKHTNSAVIQCEVPVFYATTEGQTRRIAEALAATLRERGLDSQAFDLAGAEPGRIDWACVRGVLLGASLHVQRHQRAAERFIAQHSAQLNQRPSAFFSLSMSAASSHAADKEAARRIAARFAQALGWYPEVIACLAGRLAYTQYGIVTRFVMKQISRRQGGPTDTTRDYEFTDWNEVSILAERLVALVNRAGTRSVA